MGPLPNTDEMPTDAFARRQPVPCVRSSGEDHMSSHHSFAQRPARTPFSANRRPRIELVPERDMTETGRVKWYDENRCFGFIIPANGGRDVFVHKSDLRKYGIRESDMLKDTPVRFLSEPQAGGRPVATAIAIVTE